MMNEKTPSSSSLPSLGQSCQLFSFAELSSATNNFDEKWCIGHGGSSKVYKGIFSDKTTNIYAIKRLHFMSDQGAPEFWVEVKMLSRLRHCNLVSLVGYCNEGNEMALVYEYMPHGTLYGHLHKKTTPLTWSQRLKICLGAARGMDYLHTGTGIQQGIIHRDVKSTNILLDENYAAKISDFGLAKIGPINQTLTYVSTGVKGTFGYMDPNYFYTGRLTRKSDVYAFGVVLLEVLCGRPALDESLDEGLAVWAQDHIKQGKLTQIIDSSLRNHISKSSLKVFSRIAARCLLSHPNQRPTMSEVVGSLDLALSFQERKDPSTQGRITSKKVWSLFSLKGHFELKSPGLTSTPESKEIKSSKAMSDIVSIAVATIVNTGEVDLKKNLEGQDANSDPLPAIEDLRIYGDAFPGEELQACGYHINGAISCMFQWAHYNSDGSCKYIEGETNPTYTVGLGDIGTYLGFEVVPMDVNGRKGTRLKCFANRGLVITNASHKGHFELKSSGLTSTPESKEINGSKAISEAVSIAVASIVNTDQVDLKKNLEGQDANNNPLPAIEDLRISGDAFPGEELQACGYQVNGAVSCFFQWAHYNSDGSCKYIDGETNPTYTVGLGDVDTYLGVEVVPMDVNGRKGIRLKCFAKRGLVITYASH